MLITSQHDACMPVAMLAALTVHIWHAAGCLGSLLACSLSGYSSGALWGTPLRRMLLLLRPLWRPLSPLVTSLVTSSCLIATACRGGAAASAATAELPSTREPGAGAATPAGSGSPARTSPGQPPVAGSTRGPRAAGSTRRRRAVAAAGGYSAEAAREVLRPAARPADTSSDTAGEGVTCLSYSAVLRRQLEGSSPAGKGMRKTNGLLGET